MIIEKCLNSNKAVCYTNKKGIIPENIQPILNTIFLQGPQYLLKLSCQSSAEGKHIRGLSVN